jgi:hypothetical protein
MRLAKYESSERSDGEFVDIEVRMPRDREHEDRSAGPVHERWSKGVHGPCASSRQPRWAATRFSGSSGWAADPQRIRNSAILP